MNSVGWIIYKKINDFEVDDAKQYNTYHEIILLINDKWLYKFTYKGTF